MNNSLGKWLVLFGLILLAVAFWKKSDLPAPPAELLAELLQVAVSRSPIQVTIDEIDYRIQPLYTYDLYGMGVSKHNADTWLDFLHKE